MYSEGADTEKNGFSRSTIAEEKVWHSFLAWEIPPNEHVGVHVELKSCGMRFRIEGFLLRALYFNMETRSKFELTF